MTVDKYLRPFDALHPYQVKGVDFLLAAPARQLIAIMGAGKTAIALHAIRALQLTGQLHGVVLVVAPLLIAETVWDEEAALWQETSDLIVERVIGPSKQRAAALDRPADIYVVNYDNLQWCIRELRRRDISLAVLIADEASALKNHNALRTKLMIGLADHAERRWALTGTPRSYGLIDVWGPGQFVSNNAAFPPFYQWRNANFFPVDPYMRVWRPRAGVERAVTERLRQFTWVVDQAALSTRPPVIEIVHDVPLDPASDAVYRVLDSGGITDAVAAKAAAGLMPASEMAIVTKLMQVCSGASYDDTGEWRRLHDRRLDMLAEIHEAHDRPTLAFVSFRHEIERIRERFPFAQELNAGRIDAWNSGEIDMLIAHPASAGHGVNLQHGSDTIVWFSLPWSAELYAQANARLARQGQRRTVNVHILLCRGRIDEIAWHIVHRRLAEQERLIEALQEPA